MEGSPYTGSGAGEIDPELLAIADDAIAFENLDAQTVVDELNRTGYTPHPDERLLAQCSFEEQMTHFFGLTEAEIAVLPPPNESAREAVEGLIWDINEEVEACGGEPKDTVVLLRTQLPALGQESPTILKAFHDQTQHEAIMSFVRSKQGLQRISQIVNKER